MNETWDWDALIDTHANKAYAFALGCAAMKRTPRS